MCLWSLEYSSIHLLLILASVHTCTVALPKASGLKCCFFLTFSFSGQWRQPLGLITEWFNHSYYQYANHNPISSECVFSREPITKQREFHLFFIAASILLFSYIKICLLKHSGLKHTSYHLMRSLQTYH